LSALGLTKTTADFTIRNGKFLNLPAAENKQQNIKLYPKLEGFKALTSRL